ncbi:MAG TPA: hypothetical protein VHB30_11040 [Solirubrobacteraceae bacterium]|nr:hypothetical protein [Solirubrobacteraceae bacterium]
MKVFLLHPDRDVEIKPELRDELLRAMASGDLMAIVHARRDWERRHGDEQLPLPPVEDALARDLELDTLWQAMAAGDEFVYETAKRVVLSSLHDGDEIAYRQAVLRDCLENRDVVRRLYELSVQALTSERSTISLWRGAGPDVVLRRSVQVLRLYMDVLRQLRDVADEQAGGFRSAGFERFFRMLRDELSDEYVQTVSQRLDELEFKHGVLESARLGKGDKGRDYVVRRPYEQRWTERLPFRNRGSSYGFTIPSRDENGFRALEELRGRGINGLANATARSADHVKSFFGLLRLELAFYLGCLNLRERLDAKDEPTCMPTPAQPGGYELTATSVYDVCLTFHLPDRVVGNDLDADGRSLIMVTGANQGGKSTFLRSIGLAHLMMQAGMFVAAESFRADVTAGVLTHYKREEDATMTGGKLDEELRRMSEIADAIAPGSILLCNESFASTNEREGSEIARQVIRAMLDMRIRVVFVTHMYDLAHGFYAQQLDTALFLRPEREEEGRRTFRLLEGEPLATSYGQDSYRRIFGGEPDAATPARRGRRATVVEGR